MTDGTLRQTFRMNSTTYGGLGNQAAEVPIRDDQVKVELAKQAVDESLSKRGLEVEIRRRRKKSGTVSRAGRKPLPTFQKTIRRFAKLLENEDANFGELDKVEGLAKEESLRLYQTLADLELKCEDLRALLKERAGL